jgi:hypothetical protein
MVRVTLGAVFRCSVPRSHFTERYSRKQHQGRKHEEDVLLRWPLRSASKFGIR